MVGKAFLCWILWVGLRRRPPEARSATSRRSTHMLTVVWTVAQCVTSFYRLPPLPSRPQTTTLVTPMNRHVSMMRVMMKIGQVSYNSANFLLLQDAFSTVLIITLIAITFSYLRQFSLVCDLISFCYAILHMLIGLPHRVSLTRWLSDSVTQVTRLSHIISQTLTLRSKWIDR